MQKVPTTVLDALMWIQQPVMQITASCAIKYFKHFWFPKI